ncbi:MAG: hypothetical protein IJ140_08905 [Prevotella sp.]|nr:hypothetical protein [Prevotella sp.]
MRKITSHRVCRCTPENGIVQLETHVLNSMLPRELHVVECTKDLRRKALKAYHLAMLCSQTGRPLRAIRLLLATMQEISDADYERYIYVYPNRQYYTLQDLVAEGAALMLGRLTDSIMTSLGHADEALYERYIAEEYDSFWYEKYGFWRSSSGEEAADCDRDSSEQIFADAQTYSLPLSVQSIYEQ